MVTKSFSLLLVKLYVQVKLKGGVVGTLMSNMSLEIALKMLGVPFVRANVGDRYVLEKW